MEIRVIDHHIKIFEEGSQAEMVALPLAGYDVIELFYLREIYKTLCVGKISSDTRLQIDDAIIQVEDVLSDKLQSKNLGLIGDVLDSVI